MFLPGGNEAQAVSRIDGATGALTGADIPLPSQVYKCAFSSDGAALFLPDVSRASPSYALCGSSWFGSLLQPDHDALIVITNPYAATPTVSSVATPGSQPCTRVTRPR